MRSNYLLPSALAARVRRADYKRAVGKLPEDYPDAEDGGSRNFPAIPTETAEEEDSAKKDTKKSDGDGDDDVEEQAPPDKFVIELHGASQEFLHVWLPRDEKNNFMQEHDEELLKDELRDGVREKIRLEVRLCIIAASKLIRVATCLDGLSTD